MDDFIAFGEKQGVPMDTAGYKNSGPLIRLQLKALLARNLWDTDAYFEVINDINGALQKAIEAIQNNTFEKMKLADK